MYYLLMELLWIQRELCRTTMISCCLQTTCLLFTRDPIAIWYYPCLPGHWSKQAYWWNSCFNKKWCHTQQRVELQFTSNSSTLDHAKNYHSLLHVSYFRYEYKISRLRKPVEQLPSSYLLWILTATIAYGLIRAILKART